MAGVDLLLERIEGLTQFSRRVRGESDEFLGPRPQALRTLARPDVLLEGNVEVAPAEAERTHRSTTRMVAATDPRTSFRIDVERPVLESEFGVGPSDLQRRRQNLVVECQRHLDESRGSRGGLRMTDLRLHGPERTPLFGFFVGWPEDRRQASDLGCVAGLGRSPVGLDQFDRRRRIVRFFVRAS